MAWEIISSKSITIHATEYNRLKVLVPSTSYVVAQTLNSVWDDDYPDGWYPNGSASSYGIHVPSSLYKYRARFLSYTTPSIEYNNRNGAFVDIGRVGGTGVLYLEKEFKNTAPTTPSSISVPTGLKGGSSFSVSWGASTDADGNTINYYLERSINGGSFSLIRSGGTGRTYSDTPASNWSTVTYRVRAYDGTAYSGYRTSSATSVSHNTAPTIPPSITIPELRSGKTATISWGASTDADGDTINYYLERSINGGAHSIVQDGGTSRTLNDTPQASWNTVEYRVRAYDGTVYSGYRTGVVTTVKHFPEFHMRINGSLKMSDGGWVKVNGVLREIESITVKINGVLKEV